MQTPLHFDDGEEGDGLEYVYDEVFFRTKDSLETIEGDLDTYWVSGQKWEPDVPLTPEERIVELEKSLSDTKSELEKSKSDLELTKTDLEKSRMDSDMAIAELTIVLAAMMVPTVAMAEEGVEEHV